jgi:hypothetical protein
MRESYEIFVSDGPCIFTQDYESDMEFTSITIVVGSYQSLLTPIEFHFTRIQGYSFSFYFNLSAIYLLDEQDPAEVAFFNLKELTEGARSLYTHFVMGKISVTDALNNNLMVVHGAM